MNARLSPWFPAILSLVLAVGCAGGGGAAPADAKAVTAFRFEALAVTGAIDQGARTIAVTVVDGVDLSGLVATFETTGASVKVGATVQVSGVTPNDFTTPVTYRVTAANGTTADYLVTVAIHVRSSAKALTGFSFARPSATGVIDALARTVAVAVPYPTEPSNLVADFTTTGVGVTVGATPQVSGSTPNDFTAPVTYTVTAENGTTADYTVAVSRVVRELFVTYGQDVVVAYDTTGATSTPLRRFSDGRGLNDPLGVAVDPAGGEVFVTNNVVNSVSAYPTGASGQVGATRTIVGPATGLSVPYRAAVANGELFVASYLNGSIRVFPRSADGDVAPSRVLGGPATGIVNPAGVAVAVDLADATRDRLFVASLGNDSIRVFARAAAGDVAPARVIAGPATFLSSPSGIALDLASGELLVACNGSGDILVFNLADAGNVAPKRRITGAGVGLQGIALAGGEILVSQYVDASIMAYDRLASGAATPRRTIGGAASGLAQPHDVAVDVATGDTFVVDVALDQVTVHAGTASGNAAPLRIISSTGPVLTGPEGLALDAANDELWVGSRGNDTLKAYPRLADGEAQALRYVAPVTWPAGLALDPLHDELLAATVWGDVRVFRTIDDGTPSPQRTLEGAAASSIWGVAVDTARDQLWLVDDLGATPTLAVYPRTAAGTATPTRAIKGASTGMSSPRGLALDATRGEVYVSNSGNGSITVYAITDTGDVAPRRTISGAATGLAGPRGIAVDAVNDRLYVANRTAGTITVYAGASSATGNVAPARTISGAAAGYSSPGGLALW